MKKIILRSDPKLPKVNSQILFYQLSNGYFPICDERIRKTGSVPSLLQLKKGTNNPPNRGFTRRETKREFRIGRLCRPRGIFWLGNGSAWWRSAFEVHYRWGRTDLEWTRRMGSNTSGRGLMQLSDASTMSVNRTRAQDSSGSWLDGWRCELIAYEVNLLFNFWSQLNSNFQSSPNINTNKEKISKKRGKQNKTE